MPQPGKKIHLVDHLLDPAFRDLLDRLLLPGAVPGRLWHGYWEEPGGWYRVARRVSETAASRVVFFPDANVAIRDDTDALWDALRLASLEAIDGYKVMMTGHVEYELHDWLVAPRHHVGRANSIRSALQKKTWIRRLDLRALSSLFHAIVGYGHLFGLRRVLAGPFLKGRTIVGTDPAEASQTMNAIKKKLGVRAQGLVKKGRISAHREGVVSVNDEYHCLLAIAHAITTGRESVILTADEDFVEIFWKAQWFFDTHYRAWLAAKMVRDGRFGTPAGTMDDTMGCFKGPLTLYKRHTKQLGEVLPRIYQPVRVHVVYVGPDAVVRQIHFCFEREMMGMLEMRARTNGRCTDLFGSANVHVDLGPLKTLQDGLFLGVGHDAGITMKTEEGEVFLSALDVTHALFCQERSADG
jgi:hypothetical protein